MKLIKHKLSFYLVFLFLLLSVINCQTTDDRFLFMNKYDGRVMVGHYSNLEDSHYLHQLKIKSILDGNVFVISKTVEELKFEMETIFYWDPYLEQHSFHSFTNKGQVSKGSVSFASDRIVLIGENLEAKLKSKFKQSFYFSEDGTMEDRFYLYIKGEWKQRHLIIYN